MTLADIWPTFSSTWPGIHRVVDTDINIEMESWIMSEAVRDGNRLGKSTGCHSALLS